MNNPYNSLIDASIFALPKCLSCKHLLEDQGDSLICKAFPNGIPDDALWEPKEHECNINLFFEE